MFELKHCAFPVLDKQQLSLFTLHHERKINPQRLNLETKGLLSIIFWLWCNIKSNEKYLNCFASLPLDMPIAKHCARLTGETRREKEVGTRINFSLLPPSLDRRLKTSFFRFDVAQSLSDCFPCISFASESYIQPVPCLRRILHSRHIFL